MPALNCSWLLLRLTPAVSHIALDLAYAYTLICLQDGELLIRMGERGYKLYLIRSGRICVMRPAEQVGGPATVLAVLGRGHFVGERTLVTGRGSACTMESDEEF